MRETRALTCCFAAVDPREACLQQLRHTEDWSPVDQDTDRRQCYSAWVGNPLLYIPALSQAFNGSATCSEQHGSWYQAPQSLQAWWSCRALLGSADQLRCADCRVPWMCVLQRALSLQLEHGRRALAILHRQSE